VDFFSKMIFTVTLLKKNAMTTSMLTLYSKEMSYRNQKQWLIYHKHGVWSYAVTYRWQNFMKLFLTKKILNISIQLKFPRKFHDLFTLAEWEFSGKRPLNEISN